MTKQQLIKEFREKFGHIQVVKNEISGNQHTSLEAFLLSAFSAGRASGIEEVKKKMERAVKKIEITEAEPPFYQKKVNTYATQEARKTVRNFMKYIFSPPPPVKITK